MRSAIASGVIAAGAHDDQHGRHDEREHDERDQLTRGLDEARMFFRIVRRRLCAHLGLCLGSRKRGIGLRQAQDGAIGAAANREL